MRVIYASTEVYPALKIGGLAEAQNFAGMDEGIAALKKEIAE